MRGTYHRVRVEAFVLEAQFGGVACEKVERKVTENRKVLNAIDDS